MRKVLAIILAVAMIATFVPVASATEVSGEENEIKIVCDLEQLMIKLGMHTNYNVSLSALNYAASGDAFRYIRSSLTPATQSYNEVANDIAVTKVIGYPGATPSYDNRGFLTLYKQASSGATWISFEVNIPKNGNYTFKLNHKKGRSNYAGALKVYMTDAETYRSGASFGTLLTEKGLSTLDSTLTRDADSIANTSWADNQVIFENQKMNAGKYVVTYAVENGATLARVAIGSFTFEGTPIIEEPEEPSGISIKYDITNIMKANNIFYINSAQDACAEAEKMNFNMSNGFFEVLDARGDMAVGGSAATTRHYFKLGENATIDFKVNVPQTATYFLKTDYQTAGTAYGTSVNIVADGKKVGTYNCSDSKVSGNFTGGAAGVWVDGANVSETAFELAKGEHTISFTVPSDGTNAKKYGTVASFELVTSLTSTAPVDMDGFVKISKTTLEAGEDADILGAVLCSSDGTIKAQNDASTVYTSSNSDVISVTDSKIKAVSSGAADIETTIAGKTAKRTVTVLNKEHAGNASLGVYSDVIDSVTVEIDGVTNDNMISSVGIGNSVKLTAKTDIPGYIFRGWKRGSCDNGVWWSEKETITFPMMTNTFFTAVYEPISAEETVNLEFYNYNGQHIGTAKNVGNKKFSEIEPKPTPVLTGYLNPFWSLDGQKKVSDDATFNKLTRVVAQYENVESFDITIGAGITGTESGNYKYDTALVLHSAKEGTWCVDGKVVAYGDRYLHYVWDDANITFEDVETNVPIISINDETKTNGARMISYDANGVSITEVGILFGEGATIKSFDSKAASKKRGNSQDHYTAMPYDGDGKAARGYLIYRDSNNTYRVIYAD